MSRWISCASSVVFASGASALGGFTAREAHDFRDHLRRGRKLERFVGHGRVQDAVEIVGSGSLGSALHGLEYRGDPFR